MGKWRIGSVSERIIMGCEMSEELTFQEELEEEELEILLELELNREPLFESDFAEGDSEGVSEGKPETVIMESDIVEAEIVPGIISEPVSEVSSEIALSGVDLEQEELLKYIGDRTWRLNNLYKIVDANSHLITFKMNFAQLELYDNFWNKNIILKARQLGLTTFMCILQLDAVLFEPNISTMVIAHKVDDAKHFYNNKILYAYDKLPEWLKLLRPCLNRSGDKLVIDHGAGNQSVLRVSTSGRSDTLRYLHISEFGRLCAKDPAASEEIISGALNAGPNQITTIESTAEGAFGRFFDMCQVAEGLKINNIDLTKMDYKFFFFPWYKHPDYKLVIKDPRQYVEINKSDEEYFKSIGVDDYDRKVWYVKKRVEQGSKMKQEFPSTSAEAFESLLKGIYYEHELRREGMIGDVKHVPGIPVNTAWDIGKRDSTVIIMYQLIGNQLRIINHYACQGMWMGDYIEKLREIGNELNYEWGIHWGPHDINVSDFGTKFSRSEIAWNDYRFKFEAVKKLSLKEGIDATRKVLRTCLIDKDKNERLLAAMRVYRKEFSKRFGVYLPTPHHDWSSDYMDSLRYCCLSIKMTADHAKNILSVRGDIRNGGCL